MTSDFGEIYYSTEIMIYSTEEFNKKTLEVCEKNKDILCLDLEKKVPKNLNYMYDDMHFNENGADFVAQEISFFIKEKMNEFE
jgi:hypothetical protein